MTKLVAVDASSMIRASLRFRAIRAWHKTCLPPLSAARVVGRCKIGGVAMTTASISGDSIIASQFPTMVGIPNFRDAV